MRRLPARIVLLLALFGCGDIKAVLSLSEALQAQYHVAPHVSINNRTHLFITFQNIDQSMKWDSTGRAVFAHDVAVFAKNHYAAAANLEDISVGFAKVSQAGPLTMTRTEAPFRFPLDSLR